MGVKYLYIISALLNTALEGAIPSYIEERVGGVAIDARQRSARKMANHVLHNVGHELVLEHRDKGVITLARTFNNRIECVDVFAFRVITGDTVIVTKCHAHSLAIPTRANTRFGDGRARGLRIWNGALLEYQAYNEDVFGDDSDESSRGLDFCDLVAS